MVVIAAITYGTCLFSLFKQDFPKEIYLWSLQNANTVHFELAYWYLVNWTVFGGALLLRISFFFWSAYIYSFFVEKALRT
jgi:hypothetical protein